MKKSAASTRMTKETELYNPVCIWLESFGYKVQGEVCDTDVLAVMEVCTAEKPEKLSGKSHKSMHIAVAVELKLRFTLELLVQAVDRLAYADIVYVAVPHTEKKRAVSAKKLCSKLGIGVLIVDNESTVQELLSAKILIKNAPAGKVRDNREKNRVLKEFFARKLTVNKGGTRGSRMTAYREEALTVAFYVARVGETTMKRLRELGVENPSKYLYANYYGWFVPLRKGVYALSDAGKAALTEFEEYREVLDILS